MFDTPFRWMDSGVYRDSPLQPLIYDEALAASMNLPDRLPVIHLWVYDKALFFGTSRCQTSSFGIHPAPFR